jgi:hypothetical protein
MCFAQFRYGGLEVLQGVESLVNRGESQVGDQVELLQRAQYGESDVVRGQLRAPCGPNGFLNLLSQLGEGVFRDGAALARLADAGDHLVSTEGLGDTAALNHCE